MPCYLKDHCAFSAPRMLKPVKYNMKNCRKSFAVHVPPLWNELQAIVRLCYSLSLFNTRQKMHLFKLGFKLHPWGFSFF